MGFIQAVKDKPQIPLTIAGIVAIGSAMPHLAHFVDVWRAPEAAAAARETAVGADEKVSTLDRKFNEYLIRQESYTQAINDYTQKLTEQQYVPPAPVQPQPQPFFREQDDSGIWCCYFPTREQCWDESGWQRCP